MVSAQQFMVTRLFASVALAVFAVYGLLQILGVSERAVAAAAPTNIIGYQGRLLNANGVPVADSTASIIFELYTAAAAGTCVWSNSSATCASATARTVTLTDGLFSEALGDTAASSPYAAITDSVFGNNSTLYLQVTINGEVLTPRKQILAAGYALNAQLIDGYDTTTAGATSSKVVVLDTNGNLQLTGDPQGPGGLQGSLLVNPATATVAADDVIFGVAVNSGTRFFVDAEGDTTATGSLAVNGGTLSSSVALALTSSGGNISFAPNGSGLAYITAGDDFAVGGTSLVAPFSVDESANTIRIGDGANDANVPTITFYASNGSDSGSLSYADNDTLALTGGNFSHTGLGLIPITVSGVQIDHAVNSAFSGTSSNTLGEISLYSLSAGVTYTGIEGVDTDHKVAAARSLLTISGGTATLTEGSAQYSLLEHAGTGTPLALSGFLAASESELLNSGAGTVDTGYGIFGHVSASAGSISNAVGVYGRIDSSVGSMVNGYGGMFTNTLTGTARYGLYAEASGGTSNFSGYFTGANVQIDEDGTPNTAATASGAGDLYVADAVEIDGSLYVGDLTGLDTITFVSSMAESVAFQMTTNTLTTGSAFDIDRAAGGADFDGNLVSISQSNSNATSDGTALVVDNQGGGDAKALHLLQGQITNETDAAGGTTIGAQAFVIDTTEAGSNDDIMLIRANGQITLAIESDGSILSDNAYSSAGADYAEYFLTSDATLVSTEVVCRDRSLANAVKRCEVGNDEVIGVISTAPGFIGGLPQSLAGNTVIVGLTGQIPTRVTASEGAIAIGDPITQSGSLAGYGAKASGPAQIIGFALESLASGSGNIQVLVHPQWYGADVLASDGSAMVASTDIVLAPLGTATAATSYSSQDLALRGSQWNGTTAVSKSMALRTNVDSSYRLSVVNDGGTEVAYVGESGDFALAGRLFPSDRGTLQTSKYIYYDGSTGAGGDMIRTNASGWSSGSYDFAEMFPSPDLLAAGEVVVFGQTEQTVQRSAGTTYDAKIAGVVSTKPAFLAGDNRVGDVPVALSGRVPTYVSAENGDIAIGDPLTTSSKPGYAMKATEQGMILGYAMASFSGNTGVIIAFIRPSYFDGDPIDSAPLAENTVSGTRNLANLDVSGSLNLNGGSILSLASLVGIGERWRIEEDGDVFTHGRIVQLVQSYAGEDVETYASTSREQTIELSGTATLVDGKARIDFERIDPSFNDVIANTVPYRVYLTPAGMTGMLAAMDRTNEGFKIQEAGSTSGITVDWLVVAYHKDFAPEQTSPEIDVPPVEEIFTPVIEEPIIVDEIEEIIREEAPIVEEPVVEERPPIEEVPQIVEEILPFEEAVGEPTVQEEVASVAEVPVQEQL